MTDRKFIDLCYNDLGDFIDACTDCKKPDLEGQGEYWGNMYLCPHCDKRLTDKWIEDGINAGVYRRTKSGEIEIIKSEN